MIGIVDYGSGNIMAFMHVYRKLNVSVCLVRECKDIEGLERIILPGVGAFDHAMEMLERSGLRPALEKAVLERKVPVLGVCVGMQMLANASEEGCRSGLGWIPGQVKRFDMLTGGRGLLVPHMGWNDVKPIYSKDLFMDLDDKARFYFLHSYYFHCERDEDVIAVTEYGNSFASAIRRGNIFGVQFHPEKSHQWGIRLLDNFARL